MLLLTDVADAFEVMELDRRDFSSAATVGEAASVMAKVVAAPASKLG